VTHGQTIRIHFIVDSHLPAEQIKPASKHTQSSKNVGTSHLIDRWGKNRLAFEIAKKQYGFYVYVRFEGEGKICQELNRSFKLDDAVIRFLTVTVPKAAWKTETTQNAQTPGKAPEEAPVRVEPAGADSKPVPVNAEV
jgi:small subunit ribosomal protein S6